MPARRGVGVGDGAPSVLNRGRDGLRTGTWRSYARTVRRSLALSTLQNRTALRPAGFQAPVLLLLSLLTLTTIHEQHKKRYMSDHSKENVL